MFELLFVLGLIVCVVMLTVGLFKLIFGLLLLPVKIVGIALHLVVSLVVGIIGIIVTVVLLPVLAVVAISVLIVLCVLALPFLFIWGLFHLAF